MITGKEAWSTATPTPASRGRLIVREDPGPPLRILRLNSLPPAGRRPAGLRLADPGRAPGVACAARSLHRPPRPIGGAPSTSTASSGRASSRTNALVTSAGVLGDGGRPRARPRRRTTTHDRRERSRVLVASPRAGRPNRRAVQRGGCPARRAQRRPTRSGNPAGCCSGGSTTSRPSADGVRTAPRDGPRPVDAAAAMWRVPRPAGDSRRVPRRPAEPVRRERSRGTPSTRRRSWPSSRHPGTSMFGSSARRSGMLAPTGRLRRRILFGMSKLAARRDERSVSSTC